ncbi:MAG: chorismate mutase [Roseofilum sp. SBFL]|uniref:chorismate mutase n=1 Tax=unclassified Roseofilum TaxID=2620099 RepID=UPI001B02C317|nr:MULTISPECIES: chorismate mutase [unclassified Roseofilum]MBP0012457.1 chorismate mutase [Roseofilum sp. SID3]MBP0024046.1 chorismate mutase [Roseofilum sp. SID2]MBP0037634.1 chorismate mutase [Roseofilum sp. SID1]MBP0041809.1 chorismate mutase [Roseofilum sp. SBFL]
MGWQVRAIRGATTVEANTVEAIQKAVTELLDELDRKNQLCPDQLISVTFSVTRDLDAVFPAAIARQRKGWDHVPLLDVQQMHVEGALSHCIRFLIHAYLPVEHHVSHPYLREAKKLRPDLNPDLREGLS